MGWFGYDLYDGDGTFTTQLLILEKAGIDKKSIYDDVDYIENCPTCGQQRTLRVSTSYSDHETIKLTEQHKKELVKAYSRVVKYLKDKPPKRRGVFEVEDWSISWQMFADLIMNNKLPMTKQIKKLATTANDWLETDMHCADFNEPRERRDCIKYFGRKLKKYKGK